MDRVKKGARVRVSVRVRLCDQTIVRVTTRYLWLSGLEARVSG
jgi:hypothetical protein